MAQELKLPELGENIESGTIVKMHVSEGDTVEKDQVVLELETDKAVVEVPSTLEGTIESLEVGEGDTLTVGQVILTVSGNGKAAKKSDQKTAKPKQKKEAQTEEIEEEEGKKEEGKKEEEKEEKPAKQKSKQKTAKKKTAAKKSKPKKEPSKAKAKAKEEEATAEEVEEEVEEAEEKKPAKKETAEQVGIVASPSTRRFAREIGVDIEQVPPGDESGRVTVEDIKEYSRKLNTETPAAPKARQAAEAGEPLPNFERWGSVIPREMTNVRRRTSERLSFAWQTIPHVTHFDKADTTELDRFRKEYGPRVEEEGGKLTVTAVLVRVLASALKRFPKFNASVDVDNNAVIMKEYYNIGVAVDTDRGLIVPVIHNVDRMNLTEICIALTDLAQKARDRKTSLDEMQGGCITVTNLGGIGGTGFTPIINPPEVAILAVSRAKMEQVYMDGGFQPRMLTPLGLAYDHRLIDGADAARFLRWVCDALQQPFLLSLEG